MLEQVHDFLQRDCKARVCVVGDIMLDTYVWGSVGRISQEGPIPVLHAQKREHRAGGAGSVAAMAAALGAAVQAVGLIGTDANGQEVRRRLETAGVDAGALVSCRERPTITKTRFLGYVQSAGRALQQLLRVDEELTGFLSRAEEDLVLDAVGQALGASDVLILQDHGKGLLGRRVVTQLIKQAGSRSVPVLVDPEQTGDYSPYKGATCVLPNRFEAQAATGIELCCERDFRCAAAALLAGLDLSTVVIKLDREGIYFSRTSGETGHIAAHAREVADVTGAGDMVTAATACALAAGRDWPCAVELANFAAGIEVTCHGATPLSRQRLLAALEEHIEPVTCKIKRRDEMVKLAAQLHNSGQRIAFTNGCFDLLHLGHVQLLHLARTQGDLLVVGLNSDASVRKLKGPDRPVNSEQVRARVLAALADVDYVVLFDEESVLPLVEQLRPDVLVKGGDYDRSGVVGADFVESYDGEVKLAPVAEGFSTSEIIKRIAQNDSERQDTPQARPRGSR